MAQNPEKLWIRRSRNVLKVINKSDVFIDDFFKVGRDSHRSETRVQAGMDRVPAYEQLACLIYDFVVKSYTCVFHFGNLRLYSYF